MSVIGCQKTSDNTKDLSESGEQSEVSFQIEEKNEGDFSENSLDMSLEESDENSFEEGLEEKSEESFIPEEESELGDYSGGGIVLPDDEW